MGDATRIVEVSARARRLEPELCNSNSMSKHFESGLSGAISSSSRGPRWTETRQGPSAATGVFPAPPSRDSPSPVPPLSKALALGITDKVKPELSEHTPHARGRDCELRMCPTQ